MTTGPSAPEPDVGKATLASLQNALTARRDFEVRIQNLLSVDLPPTLPDQPARSDVGDSQAGIG